MAKKSLNEEALKTNLDATVEKDLRATIDPTYKQALDDHKEFTDNAEKVKASREPKDKDFDKPGKVEPNTGAKQLHLSESLFEGVDDEDEENSVYTLITKELFGEHNYKPVLGLPGSTYDFDLWVLDNDIPDSKKIDAGIPETDNIIGVRAEMEDEDDRKEFLKRIKALAKKLNLGYKTFGKHKYGVIHFSDEKANEDARKLLKSLGINESLIERDLTKSERHNRDMERIFDRVENQNKKMEKILLDNGVSQDEIDELKKNTGLGGNALQKKIIELGLDDEFAASLKESNVLKEGTDRFVGVSFDDDFKKHLRGLGYKEDKENRQKDGDADVYTYWKGRNHMVNVFVKDGKITEVRGNIEENLDTKLDESKTLTEGAGAGYSITGELSKFKLNRLDSFVEDPDNDGFYTGYVCDVDATAELSDIEAASYDHGNVVAEGGSVPVKITKLSISAWGLETENPTKDEMTEYIKDEFYGLQTKVDAKYGGGWSHKTFGGDLHFLIKSENTSVNEVDCTIENDRVIQAIDDAVTGNDWLTEYVVYDEDGDILENFVDADEAIDFAKKNRGVEVTKRSYQTYLMANLDDEGISDFGEEETIWERDYTKSYKYESKEQRGGKQIKIQESVNKEELIKDVEGAIDELKSGYEGTYFFNLGDNGLHLVMSLIDLEKVGYDASDVERRTVFTDKDGTKYGIGTKVAVNVDDLQSDYDFDWYMPSDSTGEVYDTEFNYADGDTAEDIVDAALESYESLKDFEFDEDGVVIEDQDDEELYESRKPSHRKALKESKKLNESLNEQGIDAKFDLVDRAKSLIRDGHSADDAVDIAIDDGLIYDEDIISLAYYVGSLDMGQVMDDAYDSIRSEIYEEVKDYTPVEEETDNEEVEVDFDESLKSEEKAKENLVIDSDKENKDFTLEDVDDDFCM